jgi:hypothetical protein
MLVFYVVFFVINVLKSGKDFMLTLYTMIEHMTLMERLKYSVGKRSVILGIYSVEEF